jgi:hypothetical protein
MRGSKIGYKLFDQKIPVKMTPLPPSPPLQRAITFSSLIHFGQFLMQ